MGKRYEQALKRAEDAQDGVSRQARGTVRNAKQVKESFGVDRILPSGIADAIQEGFTLAARGAGRDNQAMGIFSGITLVIIGVATSWAGIGIPLMILGALIVGYNLIRLIPAANKTHKQVGKRVGLYKDRDIPLWRRD